MVGRAPLPVKPFMHWLRLDPAHNAASRMSSMEMRGEHGLNRQVPCGI